MARFRTGHAQSLGTYVLTFLQEKVAALLLRRKKVVSLHPIYADAAKKVSHELIPPYGKTRLKLIN